MIYNHFGHENRTGLHIIPHYIVENVNYNLRNYRESFKNITFPIVLSGLGRKFQRIFTDMLEKEFWGGKCTEIGNYFSQRCTVQTRMYLGFLNVDLGAQLLL